MKKTVVIFIGGYLPGQKYGGPVTSLENFANQLHENYNIKIICSDHDFKDPKRYSGIKDGWNQVGNAQVYYTNEKDYSSKKFYDIIKPFENEITLFYLSGIYYFKMNYAVIRMARKCKIPVLLAPRGDLMKNSIAMKSYAKKIKKLVFLKICRCFNLFKGVYFQSTSDEESYGLYHYLGVRENRIFQLPNMPVMKHQRVGYEKQKNRLRVLFISRLMVKKNPAFALEAVKRVSNIYQIEFDLYGPKEDGEYWEKCNSLIEEINSSRSNIKVSYKGALSPKEAKRIYDKYDCFLFPTVSENYGHVIVESLFSGCPVILSKGTTPFDDCHKKGGYVADLNEVKKFTGYLEKIAEMNQDEYDQFIKQIDIYIEEKFKVERLKEEYINMISKVSGKKI